MKFSLLKSAIAIKIACFFGFFLVCSNLRAQAFIDFGTLSAGNQTLCDPADPGLITFSVMPSGASSFTFNWFYKDGIVPAPTGSNPGDWTIISGATLSSYNPPAGLDKSRTYACFVSGPNAIRNWANGARQVTVYSNGEINSTYQPFIITGNPSLASFWKTPKGPSGTTFSYQWYFKKGIVAAPTGTSTTGWTLIAGATSSSYDPPAGLTVPRSYACFVTPSNTRSCLNNRWAKGVQHAMVYPYNPGNITTSQTLFCNLADPFPFTFSEAASSGSTFQWYFQNGDALLENGFNMESSTSGWTLIAGATSPTYDPPGGLTTTRSFACRVSNMGYSLWTNGVVIRITNTQIGVLSSQQTGCPSFNPAPIVFSPAPFGSEYYLLNWYYVEDPNIGCPTTSGFNASAWTLAATAGPVASGSMPSQMHDPSTSGPNGRTYILKLSPLVSPSCETPYVTNCHRIFVNPCRESVDQVISEDINISKAAFLGEFFPNPGSNLAEVEIGLPSDQATGIFSVRSLDGKIVFQQEIKGGQHQKIKVDRSGFSSGMYFYSLESRGMAPLVKKMVVQH
jgi:hypothetical protein